MNDTPLTIKEAAAILGLSPKTLYLYIEDGRIASIKYGTSRRSPVRVERSAVEAFKKKCRRSAL